MVDRVEREYKLAQRIRVSSEWSKRSMIEGGVSGEKITAIGQPIDLNRFKAALRKPFAEGPLRICFVGSLDLRKGFVYLLRAIRAVGSERVELRIVGATGDRWCRRLFENEGRDLNLRCVPGDPVPTYHWAELLVLPTLEDGFGFVVPEAMVTGLPVIVTEACGAAELVRPGSTGWIVSSANVAELTTAIAEALARRIELSGMGSMAHTEVRKLVGHERTEDLSQWFYSTAR